ncbi:MAG TPA: tetratricopeptide repeat protein [Candidatus Acidoferrum sp.]|nr:tetratricopeptide repeat protein [Candidatus Acidoferrum sp.]
MSGAQRGPGRRAPRPGGATANGSLYERYKDALRRGHVAALRGRNDAAVDAYGEAAAIAPDRALPHASIGGILVKMNRLDEASTAYDRALALAPRDEGALRGLADVHVRMGRRTEAATTLDRLADSLDAAGRLADATDAARRALELAESRARRRQVEGFATRLRASSSGDETAQRALDLALRQLEPRRIDERPPTEVATTDEEAPEREAGAASEAEPGAASANAAEEALEVAPAPEAVAEPEAEPEPLPEPAGLGIALGAAAEAALYAGDFASAREGLLAAARAHRRAGRLSAAVDACYLAIGLAPSDPDLHLLLAELYLDRGWRSQAVEKLLLLGRLADLDDDGAVRERLCALVTARLADEPRVADLCA